MNIKDEIDTLKISNLALIRWVSSEYEETIVKNNNSNKILNQKAVRSILKMLSINNGVSQNELAREVHLKSSTVCIALGQMEKQDLIKRADSDNDKRKINVYLTPKGYDLKKELDEIVEKTENIMLKDLTSSERYELQCLLLKILHNC
jgi:DNA-binding MarR family transcriptional regulator